MINIGIDAYGGDNGDIEVVKAVIETNKVDKNIRFMIYGDEHSLINKFKEQNFTFNDEYIKIIHTKEKIEMNDHPVFALRSKSNSSIFVAGQALINKDIDIFISAGNTGALVALAQFYLKPINGVDRPVVGAIMPTKKGFSLLIDSGCNVDSKPEWLYKYALLGKAYLKGIYDIDNPSIGLLSVGVEENKGNELTLATYKLLKQNTNLNFIGNIEARDVPFGISDIIIADGFAGNILLKTYEGSAKMLITTIKETMTSNIISKICALLLKNTLKKGIDKYDAKKYGGAPILGTNYLLIKCHGNATKKDYGYAIKQAKLLVEKNLIKLIKNEVEA